MKRVVFVLPVILLVSSFAMAQTPACPKAFGPEFPADVREASQAFEKACLDSRSKLAEFKSATDKAREELSRVLESDTSLSQLMTAKANYSSARAMELITSSRLGSLVTKTSAPFFNFVISQNKQGKEEYGALTGKYGAWQDAALQVSKIPERNDKELIAKANQEFERRLDAEQKEFDELLKLITPDIIPRQK